MWDIEGIKRANRDKGLYYFEPQTLRFFRSRVLSYVYEGKGGIYFVTSEQYKSMTGALRPRRYTVRKFNPETASIDTFGPFNEMTRSRAQRIARIAADYPEAALEAAQNKFTHVISQ